MKTNRMVRTRSYTYKSMAIIGLVVAGLAMSESARADAYWNGVSDSNWANLANWGGSGDPANAAGSTIINPANNPCVVSTTGNNTSADIYISVGLNAQLSMVSGGQLTVAGSLVTGQWGDSLPVNVSGGTLTINGALILGNGGFGGDADISGGTVTAPGLSINTTRGATLRLSGSGSFITSISQLNGINYWVANNAIIANGNALGWVVNVDTNSSPGNVVLTAQHRDISWNGGTSSDWSVNANWSLVEGTTSGNTVVTPGLLAMSPVISTLGNTTVGSIYIGVGAGLSIVAGGQLTTLREFQTGIWGDSLPVNITGGQLNIGMNLTMGIGGNGNVNISGGTVTAASLDIVGHGSIMNISGNGQFIIPSSQLEAINSLISSHSIIANGNAPSWLVNVDTTSTPGYVVLTAMPSKGTLLKLF